MLDNQWGHNKDPNKRIYLQESELGIIKRQTSFYKVIHKCVRENMVGDLLTVDRQKIWTEQINKEAYFWFH